jgi:hypothetical protein
VTVHILLHSDQKEQIANYNKKAAQTEHHISEAIESVESVLKEIEVYKLFLFPHKYLLL